MDRKNILPTFSKNKMGFTLIEMLVALAIMSIVSVAIYSIFSFSNKNYTTQNVAADAQQNVRAAMEIMLQDIRSAGLDPTGSHNFGIEVATTANLRFTSDSVDAVLGDFNGVVDDANSERMTYEIQGNQINQILYEGTVNQNTVDLVRDVLNLTFTYFDSDGNDLGSPVPTDNLEDISMIEISLTVQQPAGRGDPVTRILTKRVQCRNAGLS
jgi:type II secretion system protein J